MRSLSSCERKRILPTEFLTAIVHELKTPLSAIISFSEFLKDNLKNPRSAEECADYAKEINTAATEMDELVHDILDVEAASLAGNFSVDLSKEIDLGNVIKRSVKLNHDYSLKRNISLKTEIAINLRSIKLDSKRMKQILTNLISNAVKYSPKQSEIKITARNSFENNQEFLEICVIDQGFGMTNSQIQTAFQKYQTIQNPNSGSVDSFGLGLPITKQLVELQSGKLEVKSQVGQGTEIKLKFPYLM
jgi:two-component system phosphate regulon sensor histidine kinase PhoR